MRFVILAALMLAGCAHTQPTPPVIEARVERVEVPVYVACVKPAEVPAIPAKVGGQLNGDAVHDSGVLAAALVDMRAVAIRMGVLLKGCGG